MTENKDQAKAAYWPNSLPGNRAKRLLRVAIGWLLSALAPGRARHIRKGNFVGYPGLLDRQIIAAWAHRCQRLDRQEDMTGLQRWFWREQAAADHHARHTDRFWNAWRAGHSRVLDALVDHVHAHTVRYKRLVEVGCGEALLVPQFIERLPDLDGIVGLDLSAVQTEKNSANLTDPKLSFVCDSAANWAESHAAPATIYFTIGGVFEYFSEHELRAFLRQVAKSPVAIALAEPIAPDYDLDAEQSSRAFGKEQTFSHHYTRLLAAEGFTIDWQQRQGSEGGFDSTDWMLVVASKH